MKFPRIFFTYGVILSTNDYGRHWWLAKESKEVGGFESISFWDDKHGCVAGLSTLLTCTSDGGATWSSAEVLPPAQFRQCTGFGRLVILRSGRGWAVRYGGYLFQTEDGGKTWQALDLLSAGLKK